MQSAKRIYGLDILRAVAILLVIVYHSGEYISPYMGKHFFRALPDGVTVFFVLSGFLIGRILLDLFNQPNFRFSDLSRFWARRWLRTLPAYYFVLILLIVHRVATNTPGELTGYLPYFIFVQNIHDGNIDFFRESWSLSVEEWFYVIIPVLLFLVIRLFPSNRKWAFISLVLVLILFFEAIKLVKADHITNYSDWSGQIRKAIITRMDSILLGILGAIAAFYKVKAWEWRKPLFFIGMVFLLVPSLVFYRYDYNWFTLYWRIPLESTGTLFLLPRLHAIKTGEGLMFRFLTFTSIISYSMYLLNYTPFKDWVLSRFTTWFGIPPTHVPQYDLIRLAAFLGWAYFGAWLLYRFVERPFLDLRSRIAFSR